MSDILQWLAIVILFVAYVHDAIVMDRARIHLVRALSALADRVEELAEDRRG